MKKYPRWRVLSRRISALIAEVVVYFSPDGTETSQYLPDNRRLWNVKTGKRETVLTNEGFAGRFSSGGRFILTMKGDSTATDLREIATGQLKPRLRLDQEPSVQMRIGWAWWNTKARRGF